MESKSITGLTPAPQQYVAGIHLYTWVKRDNVEKSFLSKEITQQCRDQTGHEPLTLQMEVRHTVSSTSQL